jgi:ectoine hydroxylase-related dioxygenase (phytanoyl-CoA dioxygenase family)
MTAMDFTPLTPALREQFETDGFLVLRNVLEPQQIESLVAAGDRLVASDQTENRQRTKDGLYDGFRNCVAMDDAFIPLITHPKVVPLIVQLMSPNLQLVTSHLAYKLPDPKGTPATKREPGWHRDVQYTPEDLGHANLPRLDIKAAYYLSDLSTLNSGSTIFSPGSHKLKTCMQIPPGKADPDNVMEPLLKAGDCVLFENRTWHSAAANLTPRTRKAVMFGYGYRWMRSFDYFTQPKKLLDQVGDIGKQLLGGAPEPDGRFIPGGNLSALLKWWAANDLPSYFDRAKV